MSLSLIDQALVSGTRFVTTIFIGRFCGSEELGVYSLGFTVLVLIATVQESLIGMPYTFHVNRLKGDAGSEYAGSVLMHYALLAGLAVTGLTASGLVLGLGIGPQELVPVIWVLAALIPLILLRELARELAFAHLEVKAALWLDAAVAAIQVSGLGMLVWADALTASKAYIVVGAGSGVASAVWLFRRRASFALRWLRMLSDLRQNFRFGKWIMAEQLTSVVHANIVYWLLAIMLSTKTAGVFAACVTIVSFSNPFILGVNNMLSPLTAQAFAAHGRAEVRRLVRKATLFISLVMGGFCLLLIFFGDQVLSQIYGNGYGNQSIVLAILGLDILIGGLSVAIAKGLMALERPDLAFKISMLGLAGFVVIAPMAIKTWGLFGAALSWLVTSTVTTGVCGAAFLRLVGRPSMQSNVAC